MNSGTGLVILLLALLPALVSADEQPAPEPPLFDDAAPPSASEMEPTVTIKKKKDMQIKEYRLNGQLYMVEIQPTRGKPYYLVDSDGDGTLETRHDEMAPGFQVPSWVLLKW